MKTAYYTSLSKIKAYREQRDLQKEFIYNNKDYLPELVQIACNYNDKNHQKALWIIELICEDKTELFTKYVEEFCAILKHYKKESSQRPASRICKFLATSKKIKLKLQEQEQIIEATLDWFIATDKSAIFNYCAEALFALGKEHNWVLIELQSFLEKDIAQSATPGYIYTIKDLLRKLNKNSK